MKIKISVPKYENGVLRLSWEEGYVIKCVLDEYGVIVLSANSAGLVSLARHLLTLAQNNVPEYTHFHLDDFHILEKDSKELIIVKRDWSLDTGDGSVCNNTGDGSVC